MQLVASKNQLFMPYFIPFLEELHCSILQGMLASARRQGAGCVVSHDIVTYIVTQNILIVVTQDTLAKGHIWDYVGLFHRTQHCTRHTSSNVAAVHDLRLLGVC